MTTRQLLKRVEKIERGVIHKPEDVVTVVYWRPDGKDPPYDGGPIRLKALQNVTK